MYFLDSMEQGNLKMCSSQNSKPSPDHHKKDLWLTSLGFWQFYPNVFNLDFLLPKCAAGPNKSVEHTRAQMECVWTNPLTFKVLDISHSGATWCAIIWVLMCFLDSMLPVNLKKCSSQNSKPSPDHHKKDLWLTSLGFWQFYPNVFNLDFLLPKCAAGPNKSVEHTRAQMECVWTNPLTFKVLDISYSGATWGVC